MVGYVYIFDANNNLLVRRSLSARLWRADLSACLPRLRRLVRSGGPSAAWAVLWPPPSLGLRGLAVGLLSDAPAFALRMFPGGPA